MKAATWFAGFGDARLRSDPISIKYLDGRWKDEFIHRDNLDTLEHEVGAYYAADLYFGCEGYRRGRRLKKYALPSSVAWFDNDRKDPRRLLKPTILVLTSPGKYQSYYFCDGPVPDEIRNGLNEYLKARLRRMDAQQGSANTRHQKS